MTRDERLDRMSRLLPSQLEELIYRLGVPHAHLSGSAAPQATRVVEILRWAEAEGKERELERLLGEGAPGRARRARGALALASGALLLTVGALWWWPEGGSGGPRALSGPGSGVEVRLLALPPEPAEGMPVAIENGATLPHGARIKMGVRVERPVYLALYGLGSSGRLKRLHPSQGDGSTFVDGGAAISLPDDGAGWWSLGGPAGTETFILALGPAPLPALDPGSSSQILSHTRDLEPATGPALDLRADWPEIEMASAEARLGLQLGDEVEYRRIVLHHAEARAVGGSPP